MVVVLMMAQSKSNANTGTDKVKPMIFHDFLDKNCASDSSPETKMAGDVRLSEASPTASASVGASSGGGHGPISTTSNLGSNACGDPSSFTIGPCLSNEVSLVLQAARGVGVGVVVDVSVDSIGEGSISNSHAFVNCRRLPSGCIVQNMPNGYSKEMALAVVLEVIIGIVASVISALVVWILNRYLLGVKDEGVRSEIPLHQQMVTEEEEEKTPTEGGGGPTPPTLINEEPHISITIDEEETPTAGTLATSGTPPPKPSVTTPTEGAQVPANAAAAQLQLQWLDIVPSGGFNFS